MKASFLISTFTSLSLFFGSVESLSAQTVTWQKRYGGPFLESMIKMINSDERAAKILYLGNSEYLVGMNCSSNNSGDITEPWLGNGQDILFIKLKL